MVLSYIWLLVLATGWLNLRIDPIHSMECEIFTTNSSGTLEECQTQDNPKFNNIPIISGAYCYNDNSGRCKAFAGRFEFYFNTFTDTIEGPVEADSSLGIDSNGLHTRVPVSYDIDGNIVYADESINWARDFANATQGRKLKILSVNSIDWCRYAKDNLWPFRSSAKDYASNGTYWIWFFNRQTCIYDTSSGKSQIFNTRFLQNSSIRIDLDMNPILFAMQDNISNDIRMVRHFRQHWYESSYKIDVVSKENLKYFLEFDKQKLPCKINGTGPHILSEKAYRKYTNLCISNKYTIRNTDGNTEEYNSELVPSFCGLDKNELVDYPIVYKYHDDETSSKPLAVSLHNIPRWPLRTEKFFGLDLEDDKNWKIFAKDGFTYTALTTIPVQDPSTGKESQTRVRSILLYSYYKGKNSINPDKYDEYYPEPLISDYFAEYNDGKWKMIDFDKSKKSLKNLNYVDDIAYLYKCGTILIIFGPLYTEHPKDNFGIETASKIDSIYQLGIWELANAFFSMPDDNTLWVYHRHNYVTDIEYTCAKDADSLVTGKKKSGKYYMVGNNIIPGYSKNLEGNSNNDFSEEMFFKWAKIYNGPVDNPEAPDPQLYYKEKDVKEPEEDVDNSLIYYVIGIAILLILIMLIISMITLRRRRKRRHMAESTLTGRSGLGSEHGPSKRSVLGSIMDTLMGSGATVRSSNINKVGSSKINSKTKRSKMRPSVGSSHKPNSRTDTVRSPARSSSLTGMKKGSTASGKTRRSTLTHGHPSSNASSHRKDRPASSRATISAGSHHSNRSHSSSPHSTGSHSKNKK